MMLDVVVIVRILLIVCIWTVLTEAICTEKKYFHFRDTYPERRMNLYDEVGVIWHRYREYYYDGGYTVYAAFRIAKDTILLNFTSYDGHDDRVILHCPNLDEGHHTKCCQFYRHVEWIDNWDPCDYVFYSYSWDGKETYVAAQAYHDNKFYLHTALFEFYTLRNNRIHHYTYANTERVEKDGDFCREIGRGGHHSTPNSLAKLISTPEMHNVRYEDFNKTILYAKEFENIHLNLLTWDNKDIPHKVFVYNKRHKNSPAEISEVEQISQHKSKEEDDYKHFTEQVQLRDKFSDYFYKTTFNIRIDRSTEALSVIAHTDFEAIHNVVQKWLNQAPEIYDPPKFEAAFRIVRVRSTAHTIYLSGEHADFHYDSDFTDHGGNAECFVRRGDDQPKSTTRMKVSTQNKMITIDKLQVSDSGLYTCMKGEKSVFRGAHIIVLPELGDVQLYANSRILKPGDPQNSDLGRLDELERPFLRFDEKIVINCVYFLSKGLDNFSGMKFKQNRLHTDSQTTWNLAKESRTDQPNDMLMWIHSYTPAALYVEGKMILYEVECIHHYKPDQFVVRHWKTLGENEGNRVRKYVFVASLFPLPVIFPWSISTSDPELTAAFLVEKTTNMNLSLFSKVPQKQTKEGIVSGSFYSMHYRVGGWTAVWTIIHVNNQIGEEKCSLSSTVLEPEKYKDLFKRDEVKNHYGAFILTDNVFTCYVSSYAVAISLAAFNTEGNAAQPVETERGYIESLKEVIKERLTKPNSNTIKSVMPHKNSVVHHRLIRLKTGWPATVNKGDQIVMFFDARSLTDQEPKCEYQVDQSRNWSAVSDGFKLEKTNGSTIYKLYKSAAALTDSGRYRCVGSDGKTMIGLVRTLAVIPKSEDITIKVDYDKVVEGDNGSMLILSGQEMTTRCSIQFGEGFEANFVHTFSYETYNLPKKAYQPLESKLLTKKRNKQSPFYGLENTYFTRAPEPMNYWEHTRIVYTISLSKRTRDARDLLDENEIIRVTSVLPIPVKERLLPKVLSELTVAEPKDLEKHLRAQESQGTETTLFNAKVATASLLESCVKIQFTIFAGIPKGIAKLWLIYKQESGLTVEECPSAKLTELTRFSDQVLKSDIYKQGKGRNFQIINFNCILITQHTGLILVIFNAYDHTVSIEDEEKVFKHKLRQELLQLQSVESVSDMNELSQKVKTEPSRVSVRLKVGWKAILRIGDKISLVGRYSKGLENAVKCVKRISEDSTSPREEVTSLKQMSDADVKGFRLLKESVQYDDSGVYECQDTECTDCGFNSGMAPHHIHVVPNDDMLSVMLNHKTLTSSGPYEANFIQCIRGRHPYLFTEQTVSVRCAYAKSQFKQMKPTVNLVYQMFDKTLQKLVNLKSTKETEVETTIQSKIYRIIGFSIQGPKPDELKGDLKLTCQFKYDQMKQLGNDMSGFSVPVILEKKRDVSAKLMLGPHMFDELILSDKAKLMDNRLHRGSHSPLSAELFHKSGSKSRLKEENTQIFVVQSLGVPRGRSLALTVYKSNGVHKEDCFLNTEVALTTSNTPMIVKEHSSYRASKGTNYVNTTYTCTVRPEHIALVLLAFTVYNEDEAQVKESLIHNILQSVKFWLDNPSSTEKRHLETSVNTRADWRVQRLNIGWFGSVESNRKWKMLVTHQWFTQSEGRRQRFRFICYYQTDMTSEKEERFNQFTDAIVYFEPEKPAKLIDSGLYHCVYRRCAGQCDEHMLATHRRLLVLPNQDILQLYINYKELNLNEKLKTEWDEYTEKKEPILCIGKRMYVYCQSQRVPGMSKKEKFHFSVSMQNPTLNDDSHNLAFSKQNEKIDDPLVYTGVYAIRGPEIGKHYDPVTVQCRAEYDDDIFDSKDLRIRKKIEPLVKTSSIVFAELILPNIFNTEIKASDKDLEYSLRYAKPNLVSEDDYLKSTTKSTLNEGIFEISALVSLGVPKGEVFVQLVFKEESEMKSELCTVTSTRDVASDELPGNLRNMLIKEKFVRIAFSCVIRAEHVAVSIVAYNAYGRQDSQAIRRNVLDEVTQKVKQLEGQPVFQTSLTSEPERDTPSRGLTYKLVKLKVGWKATVKIGAPIRMIGNSGDPTGREISCLYQPTKEAKESMLGKDFRVQRTSGESRSHSDGHVDKTPSFYVAKEKASYEDSGIYGCETTCDHCEKSVAFVPRRLIVLPDASVAKILITEKELSENDKWEGHYVQCNTDNHPVLLSGGSMVIGCLQLTPPGAPKSSECTFQVNAQGRDFPFTVEKLNPIRQEKKRLYSYRLTAPKLMEFTGVVKAVCQWSYTIEKVNPPDVAGDLAPMSIESVKLIEIRAFSHPKVHPLYTTSDNQEMQDALRDLEQPIKSPKDFQSRKTSISLSEDVYQVNLIASLGVPRGDLTMWTMFSQREYEMISEPCRLSNLQNLTNDMLPKGLGVSAQSNIDAYHNLVNASFYCVLRPEHSVLSYMVQNSHDPEKNKTIVEESLLTQLRLVASRCFSQPNNENQLNFRIPFGSFVDYGLVKLNVSWLASRNASSDVSMLGFGGTRAADKVVCYYQYDETHWPPFELNQGIKYTRLENSFGFRIYKKDLAFFDSGIYSCNVSVACASCPPLIGFVPRRLTVLPNPSVLQIYVNPSLFESAEAVKDNYKRCTLEDVPCILTTESIFVHCVYSQPRGAKFTPKLSFTTHMIDTKSNETVNRSSELVKTKNLKQENSNLVIYSYRIKAPGASEVSGPLKCSCSLSFGDLELSTYDMGTERPVVQFSKYRRIHIDVRLSPVIFEKHTTTDRVEVEQKLREQTVNSVTNAFLFHRTAPKSGLLEGWFSVTYLVRLGTPKGTAKAYILHEHNSLIQSDSCIIKQEEITTLSDDVLKSDYYKEARGANFLHIRVMCAMSPKHVAFLFIALNSFNHQTSVSSVEMVFLRSVYTTLEGWFRNTDDTTETPFEIAPSSTVKYQILRLRVGWRGSIVEEEPIVLFGVLSKDGDSKPMCFHQKTTHSKKKEIDTSDGKFMILTDAHSSSFELIKPIAEVTDAGFYFCILLACETCGSQEQVPARQLLVFAKKMKMKLFVSHVIFDENESCKNDFTQTEAGSYFVYTGQNVVFHCAHEVATAACCIPLVEFLLTEINLNQSSNISYPLINSIKREVPMVNRTHRCVSYTTTIPLELSDTSKLSVICKFSSSHLSSKMDINRLVHHSAFHLSDTIVHRRPRVPRIVRASVQTNYSEVTSNLQNEYAKSPNYTTFRLNTNTKRIPEGFLYGSFLVDVGLPRGEAKVWTLFRDKSDLVDDPCEIKVNNGDAERESQNATHLNSMRFVCRVQPPNVALLLYAFHTLDYETSSNPLSRILLPVVIKSVQKWINDSIPQTNSSEGELKTPIQLIGDYHLVQIRVGWNAVVHMGDSVSMFGRSESNNEPKIECHRRHAVSDVNPIRVNPTVTISEDKRTFWTNQSGVGYTDSGLYKCKVLDCESFPKCIGVPERQLIVLPSSSIVQITVQSELDLKWREQQCQASEDAPVRPGDKLAVSCRYPVVSGLPLKLGHTILYGREESTDEQEAKDIVASIEGEEGHKEWNVTGMVAMPRSVNGLQLWKVSCQLSYDSYNVSDGLVETISSSTVRTMKRLQLFTPIVPKLFAHSIQSDRKEVAEKLQSSDAVCADRDAFLRTDMENRLEEGLMRVTFVVDRGAPEGWPILWLIHHENQTMLIDPCPSVRQERISRPLREYKNHADVVNVSTTCILQPEHVAFFVGIANIPGTDLNKTRVEMELQRSITLDVAMWLNATMTNRSHLTNIKCFNLDFRMIRVKVGWKASVNFGSEVIMQGRLRGSKVGEVKCYYRSRSDSENKLIDNAFKANGDEELDYFVLQKTHVVYSDSGIYHCNTVTQSNRTIQTVIGPRNLIVIPNQNAIKCALTLDPLGNEKLSEKQKMDDGMTYLLSNHSAYAHCELDDSLVSMISTDPKLEYQMNNEKTKEKRKLDAKMLPRPNPSSPSSRRTYKIVGIESKHYTGLLQITCTMLFSNLHTPLDIVKRNDTLHIECHEMFTVQEPANGDLTIVTLTTDYESQPVPQGTEFTCSGGYGRPELHYRWEASKFASYEEETSGQDFASILPGYEGGWGGPKQTFSDAPAAGLEIQGARLYVPEDPKYRGMTYAYTCVGSNQVQGQVYTIRKTIVFSVMICPTRSVKMDLSILLSRYILGSCSLSGTPNSDIQFYGYYFLTFIRQLILGLPYGEQLVRFNVLMDDIFSENNDHNPQIKSIRFEENLPRIELARRLYSRKVKPTTISVGCDSMRISLKAVLDALKRMRPPVSKRKHIVLLTLDKFVKMEPLEEVKQYVAALETIKTRFIVAVTHRTEGEQNQLNEQLVQTLNPLNFTSILPTFLGTETCDSCHPQWEDPTLRIRRGMVFDAVCDAVGSKLSPRTLMPTLSFPIPRHHWFIGSRLGVSCLGNLTKRDEEQAVAELTICQTNQTLIDQLMKKRVNYQLLKNVCKKQLESKQEFLRESVESVAITSSILLDPTNVDDVLICIQRQGDPNAQIYDATNYAWTKLTMIKPNVKSVRLVVTEWPNVTTKAALIQCQTTGFAPGMEVLFLLKPGQKQKQSNVSVYHVIGRKSNKLAVVGSSTSLNISWLEIELGMDGAQLYCLLWPQVEARQGLKWLSTLPEPSDTVHISRPVSNLLIIPNCPTAPKIRFNPDLQKSLYPDKTRLDVVCEGAATADALPFRFYYLAPTFSIILCSHFSADSKSPSDDMLPEQESSCFPVSHMDTQCDQLSPRNKQEMFYYHERCTFTYQRDVNNVFRRIEFAVTVLRAKDFGARVFCEIIDLYSAQSTGEQRARDLQSEVKTVMFNLPTQITHFFFQPDVEIWICQAVAFPFPQAGSIKVVDTSSIWLQKQLGYYDSLINFTQPQILHDHLIPEGNLVQLNYTITMSFEPSFLIPGGLREGQMKLRCSLGNVQKDLVTVIANRSTPTESVTKIPSIPKAGKSMHFTCQFSHPDLYLSSVTLHRIIRTSWLYYDVTVSTVTLMEFIEEKWTRTSDRRLRMHGMGIWGARSLGLTTMLTANQSNDDLVGFTIATAKEFDSGTFYCTGFIVNETLKYSPPFNQLVLGKDKQIAVAYRKLLNPYIWLIQSGSIELGEPIHFRCVVWTTNLHDRGLSEFAMEPESDTAISNRTVYKSPHQNSLVIKMVDEYSKSVEVGELKHRGCRYKDQSGVSRKRVHRIQVECKPPRLTWAPRDKDKYEFSDILTCQVLSGCENPQIRWDWVAGPIPQLTIGRDRFPPDRISKNGSKLDLSVLPRGGNYLFRCTASCVCVNQLMSQAVQANILIESDSIGAELEAMQISVEKETAKSDEPVDQEPEPQAGKEVKETSESAARDPVKQFASQHDPSRKALAEAESESWMSVEQVDDNLDSVGQNQYMDELRKRQSRSDDLDFEQIGSDKADLSIRIQASSTYSGVGRTRTKQHKSSSELDSTSALYGQVSDEFSQSLKHGAVDLESPEGYDEGRENLAAQELLGSGYLPQSHKVRRRKVSSADVAKLHGTLDRYQSIDMKHLDGRDGVKTTFTVATDRDQEAMTGRKPSMRHVIASEMRQRYARDKSGSREQQWLREGVAFTEQDGEYISETAVSDHGSRENRMHTVFSEGTLPWNELNREQLHRLTFSIEPDHMAGRASGHSGLSDDRSRPTFRDPSKLESVYQKPGQMSTNLDGEYRPAGIFATGLLASERLSQLGTLLPTVRNRRQSRRSLVYSTMDVSVAGFDQENPELETSEYPAAAHHGGLGVHPFTVLSDPTKTIPGLSLLDERKKLDLLVPSSVGEQTVIDSRIAASEVEGSKSVSQRDLLRNLIFGPFGDHGGRRGPPSSRTDEMQMERKSVVARGRLPPNFMASSDEGYTEGTGTSSGDAESSTDMPKTDTVRTAESDNQRLFSRFHVPVTFSEKSPNSLEDLGSLKAHRGGYRQRQLTTNGDMPRAHELFSPQQTFDHESKPELAWKTLGYRSYGEYLRSNAKSSRLSNDNLLAQTESETVVTTSPWKQDARSRTITYSGSESMKQIQRDGLMAVDHLEDRVPLHKLYHGEHFSNRFTLHPNHISPFGMKLRTVQDHWTTDEFYSAGKPQPISWTNYFSREHTKRTAVARKIDLTPKTERIHNVELTPNPARLPGLVTARCPSMITSTATEYTPIAVTWVRIPSMSEYHKGNQEEIIHYSITSRMIKTLSTRDQLNKRSFVYPPQKWSDSHTLDIVDLVLGDSGFYTCFTTFSSKSNSQLRLNITKTSKYPLCIMPAMQPPLLVVTNLLPQNLSTATGDSGCYSPNTTLLIECKMDAFRLFCEKADADAHGIRLLDTTLTANLHLRGQRGVNQKIEIKTPYNMTLSPDMHGVNGFEHSVVKRWTLQLRREYDGAYINCRATPSVSKMPPSGVTFMNWLDNHFDKIRRNRLSLQASALQICVSLEPQSIWIDPKPHRWLHGGRIGVIQLNRTQMITCTTYGANSTTPEIKVFPILPGKSELAHSSGLDRIEVWLNKADYPLRWYNYSENGKSRIFIPSEGFTSKEHLLICTAKPGYQNQTILLQIQSTRQIAQKDLTVWSNVVIFITITLLLTYCIIRKWMKFPIWP
ncbi:hypothetical protein D915_007010 [Fasciola hepatica]|uniref:Ig-like domain-containing protein n=1 Tax=Fasciola hepatica TaxID=6192 RepID=A0A4E0RW69_FASHE|nr:hypothetical protein D915_007010 [Fasciola hepatica]